MYFPANCGNAGDISGQRQQINTPSFNFSGVSNAELSFDVAYEPSDLTSKPPYSDTVVVYYSTDCGSAWTQIYSKGGATLCTTNSTTGDGTDVVTSSRGTCFVPPTIAAWRKDSVNLNALNGQASVMFSFENRSGWGNIVYLDNINISDGITTGIQSITQNSKVKIYPNPNNGSFTLQLEANSNQSMVHSMLEIYDILGRQVYAAEVNPGTSQIKIDTKVAGVYFYRVMTETGGSLISQGNLMIQ
jgi:hypothetical protein